MPLGIVTRPLHSNLVQFKPFAEESKETLTITLHSNLVQFKPVNNDFSIIQLNFTFQSGTIQAHRRAVWTRWNFSLHSNLVQFKPGPQGPQGIQGPNFTFQSGTIQARLGIDSGDTEACLYIPIWYNSSRFEGTRYQAVQLPLHSNLVQFKPAELRSPVSNVFNSSFCLPWSSS